MAAGELTGWLGKERTGLPTVDLIPPGYCCWLAGWRRQGSDGSGGAWCIVRGAW